MTSIVLHWFNSSSKGGIIRYVVDYITIIKMRSYKWSVYIWQGFPWKIVIKPFNNTNNNTNTSACLLRSGLKLIFHWNAHLFIRERSWLSSFLLLSKFFTTEKRNMSSTNILISFLHHIIFSDIAGYSTTSPSCDVIEPPAMS